MIICLSFSRVVASLIGLVSGTLEEKFEMLRKGFLLLPQEIHRNFSLWKKSLSWCIFLGKGTIRDKRHMLLLGWQEERALHVLRELSRNFQSNGSYMDEKTKGSTYVIMTKNDVSSEETVCLRHMTSSAFSRFLFFLPMKRWWSMTSSTKKEKLTLSLSATGTANIVVILSSTATEEVEETISEHKDEFPDLRVVVREGSVHSVSDLQKGKKKKKRSRKRNFSFFWFFKFLNFLIF